MSKHAKQLAFSEWVLYKCYFLYFPFICTVFLLKKNPFRPGENVMLPHCIFSLDTQSVTPPPPLLSVFYQSLLMSHFSIGETIIMFFFLDLLLLLMFAMIWGNSWPPGAKRLSAIFLLVRPELLLTAFVLTHPDYEPCFILTSCDCVAVCILPHTVL